MGDGEGEYAEYAGCVYSDPPARYGRQGAEDLSAHALSGMDCVGIPICDSHDASAPIGEVTDQWQSENGSKYVAFRIPKTSKTFPQREGIKSGFFGHLSLSHKIGSPHPKPLEVSICHKGRRKGTLINIDESIEDYKRRTLGSSNTKNKHTMSAQQTTEPMVTDEPAQAAPASAETTPAASAADVSAPASGSPGGVMPLMETMIASLPEEQRKVFVDHQLEIMRELENANKKLEESTNTNAKLQKDLEASKADGEKLQSMTNQNIADTMRSIKNFFLQGADQGVVGSPQMDEIEKMFQNHPTHHHLLSPVISCMATRNKVLESTMSATQKLSEKSKEETELFERLRGITRDSANPTYDFHGFDGQASSSVSANSGKRKAEAEPASRKRTQLHSPNMQSQLSMLSSMMNRNLPARPTNIRANE